MYTPSSMLYFLDFERQDWTSAFDGAILTQALQRGDQWPRPPQAHELTDSEVELFWSQVKFPWFDQGLHERPGYGYSDAWQHLFAVRSQRTAAPLSAYPPKSSSTILGDSPIRRSRRLTCPSRSQRPRRSPSARAHFNRLRLRRPLQAALVRSSFACLQPIYSLSCRNPLRSKCILAPRSRCNLLDAQSPRHLAAATSSLHHLSRAHSPPRP